MPPRQRPLVRSLRRVFAPLLVLATTACGPPPSPAPEEWTDLALALEHEEAPFHLCFRVMESERVALRVRERGREWRPVGSWDVSPGREAPPGLLQAVQEVVSAPGYRVAGISLALPIIDADADAPWSRVRRVLDIAPQPRVRLRRAVLLVGPDRYVEVPLPGEAIGPFNFVPARIVRVRLSRPQATDSTTFVAADVRDAWVNLAFGEPYIAENEDGRGREPRLSSDATAVTLPANAGQHDRDEAWARLGRTLSERSAGLSEERVLVGHISIDPYGSAVPTRHVVRAAVVLRDLGCVAVSFSLGVPTLEERELRLSLTGSGVLRVVGERFDGEVSTLGACSLAGDSLAQDTAIRELKQLLLDAGGGTKRIRDGDGPVAVHLDLDVEPEAKSLYAQWVVQIASNPRIGVRRATLHDVDGRDTVDVAFPPRPGSETEPGTPGSAFIVRLERDASEESTTRIRVERRDVILSTSRNGVLSTSADSPAHPEVAAAHEFVVHEAGGRRDWNGFERVLSDLTKPGVPDFGIVEIAGLVRYREVSRAIFALRRAGVPRIQMAWPH